MNHPLSCRCGALRGHVDLPVTAVHAVCYCRDCQAFARFLGRPADVLDGRGGTAVVATMPSHVRFTQGHDAMACMSLSPRGLLRWYAGCCNTPIGNTPPDWKTHYVGLVHNILVEPIDADFGPPKMRINTASATSPVASTPVVSMLAMLRLMRAMVPARLTDRYRDNPFFDRTGQPIKSRRVLDLAERTALTDR